MPTTLHRPPGRRDRSVRLGILACAAAMLLAAVLYLPTLDNPFIYDDHRLIAENRALADLRSLWAIVGRDVTRPAVMLSYALDRAIWGPGPFGFHLGNVLLHVLNVGLVATLAWRAAEDLQRRSLAAVPHVVAPVTALVFAAHPMLTQAVGYISARSELLCAALTLSATLAARRGLASARDGWLVVALLAWLGALAAKEVAALWPLLILMYDVVVLRGDVAARRRRWRGLHLPLLAVTALVAVFRLVVFATVEHAGQVRVDWALLLVELDVIRRYVSMLLVPAGQSIFHPVSAVTDPVHAAAAIAVVALLAALIWLRRRRSPLASFGLLWFLLLLAPSSALVVMDRGEPMAEHRVYLASVGVFLTVGIAAGQVTTVKPSGFMRLLGGLTAAAIVLSLSGRTSLRNQLWASPTLVWIEATRQAPDHWLPALLLGEELHRTGRHAEAVAAFRQSIAARPASIQARGNLGACLLELGDGDAAERAFAEQRALDPRSAEAVSGLATVALARGDVPVARAGFQQALTIDPTNTPARRGLALIAETVDGDPAAALRWCREIDAIAPGTPGNAECIARNSAAAAGGSANGAR